MYLSEHVPSEFWLSCVSPLPSTRVPPNDAPERSNPLKTIGPEREKLLLHPESVMVPL